MRLTQAFLFPFLIFVQIPNRNVSIYVNIHFGDGGIVKFILVEIQRHKRISKLGSYLWSCGESCGMKSKQRLE